MELDATITAACPSAFAGATGALFARTIAAVVTAHCAILDDPWPKDRAKEVLKMAEESRPFDFIIVGAGTAGSHLAGRLTTTFPSMKVLLIEAGGDPGLESEIPAFLFLNQNAKIDWKYHTQTTNKSCMGFSKEHCFWAKGKCMGGSSSINAMLYVRGHPNDFNRWKENGNIGWGYDDLIPYFKRIENMIFHSDGATEILNSKKEDINPLYVILRKAWEELGSMQIDTKNYEAVNGTRITKLLVKNGKRLNTAKEILKLASRNKNFYIIKNTKVQRIIIDEESMSAKKVEIKHDSGIVIQIKANREIVLSAGSIATPQILMLSGIGPVEHLEEIGIKNIVNLPVGQNLQDHLILPLLFQMDEKFSQNLSPLEITNTILQYMQTRTGPISDIGIADFMNFIDTKIDSVPNVQFHHTFFPKNDKVMLRPYLQATGVKNENIELVEELNKKHSIVGVYPVLIHPKSTGEIQLVSSDAEEHPMINAQYFDNEEDMKTLLSAIRHTEQLLKTKSFQDFGIKLPNLKIKSCSNLEFRSDAYWECYITHLAGTLYHPVGTAKMGPVSDKTAVVNSDLLVHGINNLRVVDAGVMPSIPGANTMASTLMIAEKAADTIRKKYETRNKEEL